MIAFSLRNQRRESEFIFIGLVQIEKEKLMICITAAVQ